ncbi:uncharacterized protein [Triticum aestivum]|uniref:uncharacterized protein n=1 Tax=Triticum aestivum TaxID=4565 RepID=UPI001D0296A4|nr:uncharacterized protein LOC123062091 [Triticum aestivum]
MEGLPKSTSRQRGRQKDGERSTRRRAMGDGDRNAKFSDLPVFKGVERRRLSPSFHTVATSGEDSAPVWFCTKFLSRMESTSSGTGLMIGHGFHQNQASVQWELE